MNKLGFFSLLTVFISVVLFFVFRGPNANVYVFSAIGGVLSIVGIVLAFLSKKWMPMVLGIVLNAGTLIFVFLLLFAMGIGEK